MTTDKIVTSTVVCDAIMMPVVTHKWDHVLTESFDVSFELDALVDFACTSLKIIGILPFALSAIELTYTWNVFEHFSLCYGSYRRTSYVPIQYYGVQPVLVTLQKCRTFGVNVSRHTKTLH